MSASISGALSGEPVRLLSIDGGGIRGLSALVLLEQLMELSNEHRRKLELPTLEPWQMFDMIGGTSTGGFVVSHLQNYNTHVVLRSYRNFRRSKDTLETMRIWQACRATSAAPTFFDPIIIDGRKYSDGGLLYNNPVQLVHGEASEVFPNREQLIISLGTGIGKLRVFEPSLSNVAQLLGDLESEIEKTADSFYRREDGKAATAGQYYRFNVPDIGDVGLEEVQKLKENQDLTEIYLEGAEPGQKTNSCAEQLAGGAYKISESVTAKSESPEGGVEDPRTQDLQRRLDALGSNEGSGDTFTPSGSGSGDMLNAPGGTVNKSTGSGSGNHFPGATFFGCVTF
ncbi:hypothetical protein BFJ71_g8265 [Fusarium oxysporum]|nr:hypothetical protein BFJ71_g8265 [Fusarium oxysporum]